MSSSSSFTWVLCLSLIATVLVTILSAMSWLSERLKRHERRLSSFTQATAGVFLAVAFGAFTLQIVLGVSTNPAIEGAVATALVATVLMTAIGVMKWVKEISSVIQGVVGIFLIVGFGVFILNFVFGVSTNPAIKGAVATALIASILLTVLSVMGWLMDRLEGFERLISSMIQGMAGVFLIVAFGVFILLHLVLGVSTNPAIEGAVATALVATVLMTAIGVMKWVKEISSVIQGVVGIFLIVGFGVFILNFVFGVSTNPAIKGAVATALIASILLTALSVMGWLMDRLEGFERLISSMIQGMAGIFLIVGFGVFILLHLVFGVSTNPAIEGAVATALIATVLMSAIGVMKWVKEMSSVIQGMVGIFLIVGFGVFILNLVFGVSTNPAIKGAVAAALVAPILLTVFSVMEWVDDRLISSVIQGMAGIFLIVGFGVFILLHLVFGVPTDPAIKWAVATALVVTILVAVLFVFSAGLSVIQVIVRIFLIVGFGVFILLHLVFGVSMDPAIKWAGATALVAPVAPVLIPVLLSSILAGLEVLADLFVGGRSPSGRRSRSSQTPLCSGTKQDGTPCGNSTKDPTGRCHLHRY